MHHHRVPGHVGRLAARRPSGRDLARQDDRPVHCDPRRSHTDRLAGLAHARAPAHGASVGARQRARQELEDHRDAELCERDRVGQDGHAHAEQDVRDDGVHRLHGAHVHHEPRSAVHAQGHAAARLHVRAVQRGKVRRARHAQADWRASDQRRRHRRRHSPLRRPVHREHAHRGALRHARQLALQLAQQVDGARLQAERVSDSIERLLRSASGRSAGERQGRTGHPRQQVQVHRGRGRLQHHARRQRAAEARGAADRVEQAGSACHHAVSQDNAAQERAGDELPRGGAHGAQRRRLVHCRHGGHHRQAARQHGPSDTHVSPRGHSRLHGHRRLLDHGRRHRQPDRHFHLGRVRHVRHAGRQEPPPPHPVHTERVADGRVATQLGERAAARHLVQQQLSGHERQRQQDQWPQWHAEEQPSTYGDDTLAPAHRSGPGGAGEQQRSGDQRAGVGHHCQVRGDCVRAHHAVAEAARGRAVQERRQCGCGDRRRCQRLAGAQGGQCRHCHGRRQRGGHGGRSACAARQQLSLRSRRHRERTPRLRESAQSEFTFLLLHLYSLF